MAYIYLLDIYKLIDQRMEDARISIENLTDDPVEKKYQEGRIKALLDFRAFLNHNFNPKLPKRIRQALTNKI